MVFFLSICSSRVTVRVIDKTVRLKYHEWIIINAVPYIEIVYKSIYGDNITREPFVSCAHSYRNKKIKNYSN